MGVYYNGGGYFVNSNAQIIAHYKNKLPAIIKTKYGNGLVILSGVHFEIDQQMLEREEDFDGFLKVIVSELKIFEEDRLLFCKDIIARLIC